MFCGKCGAQNEEGAAFCTKCGAALGEAPASGGSAGAAESKKNKKVGLIAVGAVAIAVILLCVKLFGGGSASDRAVKFMNAILMERDEQAVVRMLPNGLLDTMVKSGWLAQREDFDQIYRRYLDGVQDTWDTYSGMSLKLEAAEETALTEEELQELQEEYADCCDVKLKDAKDVTVNMLITVDGHTFKMPAHVRMVKVGGSWYADIWYIFDSTTTDGLHTQLVNFGVGAMYARRNY